MFQPDSHASRLTVICNVKTLLHPLFFLVVLPGLSPSEKGFSLFWFGGFCLGSPF